MEKLVKITNRNAGWTGYTIPDTKVTRNFAPKETKSVPLDELKQLQYVAGGDYLLKHCFVINDRDARSALNMEDQEPEYFYTETEIKTLLETGTLDQLEDCLNFAPEGVIDIIKQMAVKTELPDTRKRKMISEKTGFNIDNAIMVNTIMNENSEPIVEESGKTRKAAPITAAGPTTPVRKSAPVAANKYKVVEK